MPTEAEHTGVTFTAEGEMAVAKAVERYERRLRARAIDEAISRRGVPAEVTGSDVFRASRERTISMRLPPGVRNRAMHGDLPLEALREYWEPFPEEPSPPLRRPFYERLATLYIWSGAITALAGLLYAPLRRTISALLADQNWERGLVLFLAGLAIAVVGVLFRSFARDRKRADITHR